MVDRNCSHQIQSSWKEHAEHNSVKDNSALFYTCSILNQEYLIKKVGVPVWFVHIGCDISKVK